MVMVPGCLRLTCCRSLSPAAVGHVTRQASWLAAAAGRVMRQVTVLEVGVRRLAQHARSSPTSREQFCSAAQALCKARNRLRPCSTQMHWVAYPDLF